MSRTTGGDRREDREALLRALAAAGRELSDAAVMYHSALAARFGLNASEWKMLGILEQSGPLTAGELSSRSGLAPASVTGILKRLEGAGWLRRESDPADRRRTVVRLDVDATAERFTRHFSGLADRLGELYARYGDEELRLILDVIREIAARQREATAELGAED